MRKHVAALAALLVPSAAFAMMPTPVPETTPPPGLADALEPGSVLVFPFFQQGSAAVFAGTQGAFTTARTVFEITAKCPEALSPDVGGPGCVEQTALLHIHYTCPGAPSLNGLPSLCQESDFIKPITFGSFAEDTITFNPSGVLGNQNGSVTVPSAPCQQGYMIVYVEDSTGNPVKFDGLIGDARIATVSGAGASSYKAIAIQADPKMPNWEKSNDGTSGPRMALGPAGSLVFDGGPRHYLEVTGQASGEVSWISSMTPPFSKDKLVFMTLDVKSGLPNPITFVPLNFFNNEIQHSDGVGFVCWGVFNLDEISPYLTLEGFGSSSGTPIRTGNFRTDQAFQTDFLTGAVTNVTLLGLEKSNFSSDPNMISGSTTQMIREFSNNSIGIPTSFFPKQ